MRYGETGFDLEIDLSRGSVDRVATDPRMTELHLGGLGTAARILWDRVPADAEAFSEDNLLIFSTGLLCGTTAPGANRTIVSTFSPQTGLLAYSMMGGFWAPELKYAGYDKVILRGKSPKLVYLWIHNDKVELRDASHLAGKGTLETAEYLRKELKEPDAQIASIGLAGENRVFYASIEQGRSSASRGGIGAVMGDKGLKAIVVRGTKDLYVAKPEKLNQLSDDVLAFIQDRLANPLEGFEGIHGLLGSPQEMKIHDEQWHTTNFSWGNVRERRKDFWTKEVEDDFRETQESYVTRLISCYNCPMKCAATVSPPGQPTYMMKCFSKLTYTMAAYSDLKFGFKIAQKATEHGVDAITAPQSMALGLELLEAGILTKDDFPGMPDDVEGRFYYLLEKIVRREGIGDVLADGVYWATRRIGKGAEKFDHHTIKKLEQHPIRLSMLNPIYFLMLTTGEKISITQIEGQFPQGPLATRELREKFIKDWIQVPHEKFKQYFLDWDHRGENSIPYYPTVEMSCEIVDWMEKMHTIDDALGTCAGLSSFVHKPPYHFHNFPEFISAATGMDISEDELSQVATRNRTLLRAINVRRGMRRSDEKANHWKHRFPELETQLHDAYYKLKGFNSQGIPTKEALEKLDLAHVAEDFEQRGIYNDGQS